MDSPKPASKSKQNGSALNLVQKIAFGALILLVIIFISHFGLNLARGLDPLHATRNSWIRTIQSVKDIFGGDLGVTRAATTSRAPFPVIDVAKEAMLRSLGLLGVSLLFSTVVGTFLGILAGLWRRNGLSLGIIVTTLIGVSLPSFFTALLFQIVVITITRRIWGRTFLPVGGFGWDDHLILPGLVLAARPLAQITWVTFLTISDLIEQDHVRTAYSKGLKGRTVILRHVIYNSLIPILTTISLSVRFSLSSLPVVETYFGWRGAGFMLLNGAFQNDYNLTMILAVSFGLLFILQNIFLDFLYKRVDPRLKTTPDHIARDQKFSLGEWWRSLITSIRAFLSERLDKPQAMPEGFSKEEESKITNGLDKFTKDELETGQKEREKRIWQRGTLRNPSFMVGGLIILVVLFVFFFGTQLAPHSPFTTREISYRNGVLSVPPFPPGDVFPLGTDMIGRDMLSMILAGVQPTMTLVVIATAARLVVGFIFGAVAGWNHGGALDRFLLGLAETIAAFPTLLLSMILILGFGIQNGMLPFVLAFCFVGWGEIMQYVRAQVISIRPKLFIESAVAIGMRFARIITKQVLPNLVPGLISLSALEMSAVLMLLGELGFLGIFINGGVVTDIHYADVPEWGSLLAATREWARAYPWTAGSAATAFFTVILGLNLFGEGVRRMVEIVGVRITQVINRYTIGAVVLLFAMFFWIKGDTGTLAFYKLTARDFDGQDAYNYILDLTDEAMDGRSIGSPGMETAAEYIATEFQRLDIQTAGEELSYFQTIERDFSLMDGQPALLIDDEGAEPVYRSDFAEFPYSIPSENIEAAGKVRVVSIRELFIRIFSGDFEVLKGYDYSTEIILVTSEIEYWYLRNVPKAGMLVVTEDPDQLEKVFTPAPGEYNTYGNIGLQTGDDFPVIWINEETTDRILSGSGTTVADIKAKKANLEINQIVEDPTEQSVTISAKGNFNDNFSVRNVTGFWPGSAGQAGANQLDNQMIVVLAKYDSPPNNAEGKTYSYANDNASGVALMLEAIRLMYENDYQPFRTFLFVAYSGEGQQNGERYEVNVEDFLRARRGFINSYNVIGVVDLRGVGAGEGERVVLQSQNSPRLLNVFESAGDQLGVSTSVVEKGFGFDLFANTVANEYQDRLIAPTISLSWEGWENNAATLLDTPDSVSPEKLDESGKLLSLALMIMGREIEYWR